MSRPLRSNFEPGSVREASRRAQWKALGLSDEDFEKPKIAVVNSSSELAICFRHLDGVAAVVKDAIRAAGGLPFEVRTTAPSDFIVSADLENVLAGGRHVACDPSTQSFMREIPQCWLTGQAAGIAAALAADADVRAGDVDVGRVRDELRRQGAFLHEPAVAER